MITAIKTSLCGGTSPEGRKGSGRQQKLERAPSAIRITITDPRVKIICLFKDISTGMHLISVVVRFTISS